MEQQQKRSVIQNVKNHLSKSIIAGLLILFPIAITYVLILWIFNNIDGLLQPALQEMVGRTIPGLGVATLLLIVYLLGLIWTKQIGRRAIRKLQHYLLSIPVIGAVYGPARKLIESFAGDGAAGFKRVVVVEYPKQDTWMVGFLTGVSTVTPGTVMGVVYLPTAPTPNSGWVAMIPIQHIYDTTMSVQQAMSMVLSGGISSPPRIDLDAIDSQEAITLVERGGVSPEQA